MKIYVIFTIMFICINVFAENHNNYIYEGTGNQECITKDFNYKLITKIHIENYYGYNFIVYKNKKIEIGEVRYSCNNIDIDDGLSGLPKTCSFFVGGSCIDVSNNDHQIYQYLCDKNGCEKMDTITQYEPDEE